MASIVRADLSGVGGSSVQETFTFGPIGPGALYGTGEDNSFYVLLREKGVAYGETDATECTVRWESIVAGEGTKGIAYTLSLSGPCEMWGINFAGLLQVKHGDGNSTTIFLPGVRTYDPTGRTGDPHASERVGASCAAFQTAVTVAELAAVANGATQEQLDRLQSEFAPCLNRYHGRLGLFQWMKRQIDEAVLRKQTVTPFPEFIKEMVKSGDIDLTAANQEHTRLYMESYDKGHPCAPPHFFRKVQVKDQLEDVVKQEDLDKFKSLLAN